MNLNTYIGQQIKKNRLSHNMTQDELADKLHTTRQTISRYESGDRKTTQDTLFELSKIFHTSVDSFFPKEEEEKQSTSSLLAAHIDDDASEDEINNIMNYIDFLKNKRND